MLICMFLFFINGSIVKQKINKRINVKQAKRIKLGNKEPKNNYCYISLKKINVFNIFLHFYKLIKLVKINFLL